MRLSILAAATAPTCRIRLCRPDTGTFTDHLADGAGHTFFMRVFRDGTLIVGPMRSRRTSRTRKGAPETCGPASSLVLEMAPHATAVLGPAAGAL